MEKYRKDRWCKKKPPAKEGKTICFILGRGLAFYIALKSIRRGISLFSAVLSESED